MHSGGDTLMQLIGFYLLLVISSSLIQIATSEAIVHDVTASNYLTFFEAHPRTFILFYSPCTSIFLEFRRIEIKFN